MWISLVIAFLTRWLPLIETLGPEVVKLAKEFLTELQKQQQMRAVKSDDPVIYELEEQAKDLEAVCDRLCCAAQHNQKALDALKAK